MTAPFLHQSINWHLRRRSDRRRGSFRRRWRRSLTSIVQRQQHERRLSSGDVADGRATAELLAEQQWYGCLTLVWRKRLHDA